MAINFDLWRSGWTFFHQIAENPDLFDPQESPVTIVTYGTTSSSEEEWAFDAGVPFKDPSYCVMLVL